MKRFQYHAGKQGGAHNNVKDIHKVTFEVSMDFGNILNQKSEQYSLHGVIYHHGNVMRSGHYSADVCIDGVWYNFDDAGVAKMLITPAEIEKGRDPNVGVTPYMLFYLRNGE